MLLTTDFIAYLLAYFAPNIDCEQAKVQKWFPPEPTIRILRFCYDQLLNEANVLFTLTKNRVYVLQLAPKIALKYKSAKVWYCKCDNPFNDEV